MKIPDWYVLCECGCGQRTNLAEQSRTSSGWVKGKPKRFVLGHGNRKHPHGWSEEDRGFATLCWVWLGDKNAGGYAKRGDVLVYREMWEQQFGVVPAGLELDHLCCVTSCVRPDHLQPVTHAENVRRGSAAKLTPEEVQMIRGEEGSLRQIARKYGVSHPTILRIRRGDAWV